MTIKFCASFPPRPPLPAHEYQMSQLINYTFRLTTRRAQIHILNPSPFRLILDKLLLNDTSSQGKLTCSSLIYQVRIDFGWDFPDVPEREKLVVGINEIKRHEVIKDELTIKTQDISY